MNPRERILNVLHREVPDRVPLNYSANPGIDARLKKHFGLSEKDSEGLLRKLQVDFRGINPRYTGPVLHADIPDRSVDMWGIHRRWVEHQSGGYWDFCDFPLKEATVEEVERWPLPNPDHFDYESVPHDCARLGNYGLYTGHAGTGDIINSTGMLRTMEQVLIDLILDEEACLRLIDRKLAIQLEVVARTLDAAKGRIDFLWLGEDLGTQTGPLISVDLFRKVIRPRHMKFLQLAKSFNIPVMMHCCGSSSWAFDEFIEMGVAAVDTLQPEARNMQPSYLKSRFGGKLAFHGCISTAGTVAFGSAEEVVRDARETLQIMMPQGGYCFAPTHMLQDNSPTENVLAMYQTAQKFGVY